MIGYFEILGAVAIWAFFNGVLVRGIKTSGVGVGIWTALVGLVTFLIIFLFFGLDPLNGVTSKQALYLLWLGIFAALNNTCYYTALKISIPVAALFHYLAPLIVIVWPLLFPIFYEPIEVSDIIAAMIGLAGFFFIAKSSLKTGNRTLFYLGAGSAIFYSLEIILSGYVSNNLSTPAAAATFFKFLFQALTMVLMGWVFRESLTVKNKLDWLKITAGGLLLYFSFMLYFYGSVSVSSLERGVLGYIDRIGAIVLGCWFFKEERAKLTKEVWIGGALILGAGLLIIV